MKAIFRKYFKIIGSVWGGCLVLSLFVYMYALSPQERTCKQIEKQLAEAKQTYEAALRAAQEETRIQLKKQIERLRDELGDFVLEFEDSANLTLDISRIASEKKLASFSIKGTDRRGGIGSGIPGCEHIQENNINIGFTAGFNQFAAFLTTLERHRPVVFVDKFRITRSEQDGSAHPVDMELAVLVRKRQEG
jgi:hypothetical protein